MKKLLHSLIFIVFAVVLVACESTKDEPSEAVAQPSGIAAGDIKQDVHYQVLADNEKLPNTIVEVFSVFCSYCYMFEIGVIPALLETLPADTKLVQLHVKELGREYGLVAHTVLAVAKSQSEAQYEAVKKAYFDFNYVQQLKFESTEQALELGLTAAKLSKEQYDELATSPEVAAIIEHWLTGLDAAKEHGTPTLIIQNKYVVLMDNVKTQEDFNSVVGELLKK
jgi:thiol:disulfide interchange protein DsbA